MKKICFLLLILFVFLSGVQVFAQESSGSKVNEFYSKSFNVEKVYTNRYGYKVVYWTPSGKIAEMYIPMSWFDEAGGKATIVFDKSPSVPYFEITWKSGEFVNVALYVYDNYYHHSWGIIRGDSDAIKSKFDVEELNIQF